MHGRGDEQRGDRRALGVGVAIGEDDEVRAVGDRLAHLRPHVVDRHPQPRAAFGDRVVAVDGERREAGHRAFAVVDEPQLRQLLVGEDRRRAHDLAARVGAGFEQVALGADRRVERRHQRFEVGVERRVRDLREQLLEVLVEHARPVGDHRHRRVGAHRAERLDRVARHRSDDEAQILLRVTEHALLLHGRAVLRHERELRRQVVEVHEPVVEPLLVRMQRRELGLDLVVGNDAALLRVDEERAPRLEPALAHDVLGRARRARRPPTP